MPELESICRHPFRQQLVFFRDAINKTQVSIVGMDKVFSKAGFIMIRIVFFCIFAYR